MKYDYRQFSKEKERTGFSSRLMLQGRIPAIALLVDPFYDAKPHKSLIGLTQLARIKFSSIVPVDKPSLFL